jgi:hypothetical protein
MGRLVLAAVAVGVLLVSPRAEAGMNIGAEGGFVKRSADAPSNLRLGLGYGFHAEVDAGPWLEIGPYFLHAQLSADVATQSPYDATVEAAGLRARVLFPTAGAKPYAYAGLGYGWIEYRGSPYNILWCDAGCPPLPPPSGHMFEVPLGAGVAIDLSKWFQMYTDVALRPAFGFGGDAFTGAPAHAPPGMGWSFMMGVAFTPHDFMP